MKENQKEIDLILSYEGYLIGFFCVTFIFRLINIPFSSVLFTISSSALTLIYVIKAYDRIDDILDPWTQYLRKCTMYTCAVGIIAILFHFQNWPNADQIKLVYIVGLPLIILGLVFKNIRINTVLNMTERLVVLGTALAIGATYLQLI